MNTMSDNRDLWFLDSWVTIRRASAEAPDGVSILEHHLPAGSSPPRHMHEHEDEIFHVLEGRLLFLVDGHRFELGAGEACMAHRNSVHTYKVVSDEGARALTIIVGGAFESFVRALSRPAGALALPVAPEMSRAALQALVETGAAYGIRIVGPPL